jgi:hypothetical protein
VVSFHFVAEEYELVPDREQYLWDIEQLRERTQLLRTPDMIERTPPRSAGKDIPRTPLISKREQMLQSMLNPSYCSERHLVNDKHAFEFVYLQ